MVRVLVLTHGSLGYELVAVAEKILGPVAGIDVMSNEGRSAPQLADDVQLWLDAGAAAIGPEVATTAPAALIVVDDPGGSCATAALCCDAGRVPLTVIGGVNLAMILGLVLWRESLPPRELAARLIARGRQAVVRIEPPV